MINLARALMTSKMSIRVLYRWLNARSRGEKGNEKNLKKESEHSSPIEISKMGGFAPNLTLSVSVGRLVLGAGIILFGVVISRIWTYFTFDRNML
jgi:hypothetical protein